MLIFSVARVLSHEWPLKNCSRDTGLRMTRRVSSEGGKQSLPESGLRSSFRKIIIHSYSMLNAVHQSVVEQHNSSILLILISHFCFIIGFCLGGNVSS